MHAAGHRRGRLCRYVLTFYDTNSIFDLALAEESFSPVSGPTRASPLS